MRGRGILRPGLRARWAGVAAVAAVVAVVLPGVVTSTASWNDTEWSSARVGTSQFDCGTDSDYTTQSSGRFLSGSLGSQNLDSVATVKGVDVTKTSTTGTTVDPATAPALGTPTATTAAYGNPLNIGLLSNLLGLDLTGLGLGLPLGSAGAVNQIAQSSAKGDALAASGLVSNSGGVLVTDSTPTNQLPQPASVDLAGALPAISNISDAGLEVGAIGSSAQLGACDLLQNQIWGGAAATQVAMLSPRAAVVTSPVTRDYGIASLDVKLDSPLVGSLVTGVNNTVTSLNSSLTALVGTNGALSTALQQNILGALTGSLGLGTVTGTVSISGLDLSGALSPLLTQRLSDGTVSVDLSNGAVTVDLAHLLGDAQNGLNDLPPNTQIVLNATLLGGIAARVGALLNTWTSLVTSTITTLLKALTIHVALQADISANLGILGTLPILHLNLTLDSGLAAVLNGTTKLTVGATLLGLNLGVLTDVVAALIATLVNGLPAVVVSTLTTSLISLVTTLGTTLTAIVTPLLTAVAAALSALPSVLSVEVNVQTATAGGRTGSRVSTGAYSVTALRVVLASGVATLNLARSTVGPASIDLAALHV